MTPLPGIRKPGSVYIAFEVFPRPKGASTHIAAMVTAMARRYAPVWLLCCGQADMPVLQVEGDIIIHRHRAHHRNMLRRTVEFSRFVYDRLAALENGPALCVFRDPWSGVPALNALPDTPAIFEVNGLPSWELPYSYPMLSTNGALRAKIEDMERLCLHASDALITVSAVTRDALAAGGVSSEQIAVVPNSATDVFFEAGARPCSLEALAEGRWLGYFGSSHSWQGVDVLIEAWARVAEEWPEVRLLLVFGRRSPAVKDLAKRIRKLELTDRVHLHPPMPPEVLAEAMSRMELTCAPLVETFRNVVQGCCPVKIVESMATGTPVLASNLRVNRALIRHGVDGYLARPGDVRDWALAIRRLLSDSTLRARLAAGARQTAATRFTQECMFDRLQTVFGMAVSRRPPAKLEDHTCLA